MEIAMRNADTRRRIDCLTFSSDEYAALIVPDNEDGRRDALTMFFGDPMFEGLAPDDYPARLIVRRVKRTQAQLDALPEWEP